MPTPTHDHVQEKTCITMHGMYTFLQKITSARGPHAILPRASRSFCSSNPEQAKRTSLTDMLPEAILSNTMRCEVMESRDIEDGGKSQEEPPAQARNQSALHVVTELADERARRVPVRGRLAVLADPRDGERRRACRHQGSRQREVDDEGEPCCAPVAERTSPNAQS